MSGCCHETSLQNGRILIPYSKMHVDALIKKEQMCGKFGEKISNSWSPNYQI